MFEKLADSISNHRIRWSLVVIALTTAMAYGIKNLRPDMSFAAFFSGEDPAKEAMDRFKAYWGADDGTLIVLAETTRDTLLEPVAMGHLQALSENIEELDFVLSVSSIATIDRMRNEDDSLIIENTFATMPEDSESLERWRAAILSDETLVPSILSKDGKLTAIMAEIATASDDIEQLIPLVEQFRETLAPFNEKHGITLVTAGIPAIRRDFSATFFRDQAIFGVVGGTLVALVLFQLLHSLQGITVTAVAAFVPLLMLLGLMGYTGATIDVVNQCIVTVLPAIAAADAIHLLARFHEEARQLAPAGQRLNRELKSMALRRSLKQLGRACFLTSLTTAVGFASLYFAQMPILREFGLFAAIGVCFAYLSVLCLVPLVLHWTRGHVEVVSESAQSSNVELWISRVVRTALESPKLTLAAATLATLIFSHFSNWVEVNNHLSRTLNDDHPTSVASKTVDETLGGILQTAIDISGPPGTLKRPDLLTALNEFSREAELIDEIRVVSSPSTLIREAHYKITGHATIPQDPNAVAQLFLLVENHSELKDVLSLDYGRARAIVTSKDNGALGFEKTEAQLRELMAKHLTIDGVSFELTGTPVVGYRGINRVTEDLRSSLIFAFLVVGTVIAMVFRSVPLALISLIPNGVPLLIGYGMLGLVDYQLDPTAALIFTVGLGIAVDDTIHLLARFREEQSRHADIHDALVLAFSRSGRAILVTTIILVIGIGVNILSAFAPIQAMALAGVTIVASAFICDITVLPVLLKVTIRAPKSSVT